MRDAARLPQQLIVIKPERRALLEHRAAFLTDQQVDRHPFGNAIDDTMHMFLDRLLSSEGVEFEHEDLVFVDHLPPLVRQGAEYSWSARGECIQASAGKCRAIKSVQWLLGRECTAQSGRQIGVKVTNPVAPVCPPTFARRRTIDQKRIG